MFLLVESQTSKIFMKAILFGPQCICVVIRVGKLSVTVTG